MKSIVSTPTTTEGREEMKSRDFCYWLQGYFEINDAATHGIGMLTPDQVATIKAHLAMVFVHEIDPSFPADQQK